MKFWRLAGPAALAVLAAVPLTFDSAAASPSAPAAIAVDRLAGPDRFATAVAVSRKYYPTSGVPVVYIANGLDFPDALSAAPAAAHQGGPLLIVQPTVLPDVIAAEIDRLAPPKIVVVGGPSAVSDQVYAQLSAHAPAIVRVSGANRFDTSLAISRYAFAAGASPQAFVATGANFPDALAAAGAAGAVAAPVILVNGVSTGPAPAAVVTELHRLGTTDVVVAGGPSVVYPQLEKSLAAAFTVERLAGANRYGTSGVIDRERFATADHVFLATGTAFPDALTGAAAAGARHDPLYVVPGTCVPSYVLEDLTSRGVTSATLVGGTGALGRGVAALTRCADPSWLVTLNRVRGEARLPALVEDPRHSGDIAAHVFYMEKTGQFQHTEDADSPWYTDRGRRGGQNDLEEGQLLRTEDWLPAPFHLASLLSPWVDSAGAAGDHFYGGEGTGSGDATVDGGWPRMWPSSSTVLTPELTTVGDEWPDPTSPCGSGYVGLPLYIEFDPGGAAITSASATFKRGTTTLPSCVVIAVTYTNPDATQQNLGRSILGGYNSMYVIPRDALALNTTYTLTVTTNLGPVSTTVTVGG